MVQRIQFLFKHTWQKDTISNEICKNISLTYLFWRLIFDYVALWYPNQEIRALITFSPKTGYLRRWRLFRRAKKVQITKAAMLRRVCFSPKFRPLGWLIQRRGFDYAPCCVDQHSIMRFTFHRASTPKDTLSDKNFVMILHLSDPDERTYLAHIVAELGMGWWWYAFS